MTPFEYVAVLISIILGLGITQIVTGVADLVHQWKHVKVYWPHLCWIMIVFFLQIQEWWATYELRHFTSLRLPTFFFVLLYPMNLFILSRILFPLKTEFDLKEFYLDNYRKFFLWASLLPALSLLNNVFVTDHPLNSQIGQIILLATLLILGTRKNLPEWVHKMVAIVFLATIIGVLGFMWNDALTTS